MKKIFFLLFLLFFLFPQKTLANVYINEFSSASNPEWVELYNSDSSDASLNGWILFFQDNPSTSQKSVFGAGDFVPARGYKIFERTYSGTQAWLSNSGDAIILKNQNLLEIDSVRYGSATGALVSAPSETQSGGRSNDEASSWIVFDSPSKGSTNNVSVPTPTPSESASATPTPTVSSISTSTPKPSTSKPTVSLTSTPTPKATTVSVSMVREISSTKSSRDILGTESSQPSTKPTNKPQDVKTLGASENNLSKILIGLGAIIIISGVGIYIKSLRK